MFSKIRLGLFFLLFPVFSESGFSSAILSGTELRAGYRTDYIFRGRRVGSNVMDAQFSSGLAITDSCDFNFSGYLYQTPEMDEFTNLGAYGEFVFYLPAGFKLVPFAAVNEYRNSDFESGAEWGLTVKQEISKAWFWDLTALYDTGQQGSYGSFKLHYFPQLSETLGVHMYGGMGAGYDYFETRGVNEFFFRISIPMALSDYWTLEPFMGISSQHGQNYEHFRSYYGVWVSFLF